MYNHCFILCFFTEFYRTLAHKLNAMIKYPFLISIIVIIINTGCKNNAEVPVSKEVISDKDTMSEVKTLEKPISTYVDSFHYHEMLNYVANGDTTGLWPVKDQSLPLKGAILPFNRIVAYYGNLYSKRMGILGELPPKSMWERLLNEVEAWKQADTLTPVIPALHYIAVVAQGSPQKDNTWRLRMPDHQIDSVIAIAKMHDALVFLDVQVGLSTVQQEIPRLEKYLLDPNIHLGIDPEFSMKDGTAPGKKIGTFDAEDVNYCTEYLANLVKEYNLPPKILIVHRFTKNMLTNYKNIKLLREVQIVIDMDGFGRPELKYSTQSRFIRPEPVQFTGFKLFYKNDTAQKPHHLLTPEELMKLSPRPVYIQFQ